VRSGMGSFAAFRWFWSTRCEFRAGDLDGHGVGWRTLVGPLELGTGVGFLIEDDGSAADA